MNDEANRILTVKDIQERFGCGKNQAYEIFHSNGFPGFQIGKRCYVCEKAFLEWLERNQRRMIMK